MKARALVPAPARRLARQYHRWLAFQGAISRSADRVAAGELPASEVGALTYGWGNEGFSAENGFLTAAVRHAASTSGPILECGSGLSTVLLSIATRSRRTLTVSLESDAGWAKRVERAIRQHGGQSTIVQRAPLRYYAPDRMWYDADFNRMPATFSLVVCDGPPGDTPGGRYGLVPLMRDRLAPGCVILLDDVNREPERAIAERWADELSASLVIEGDGHAIATLTLPS